MATSVEVLSASRRLYDLGKYDEAKSEIQHFLEAAEGLDRLNAVVQLQEVLEAQGFLKDAFELVQREIQDVPPASKGPERFRLELQACLLSPIILGSFKTGLEQATAVFKRAVLANCPEQPDTTWWRVHLLYSKIRAMVSHYHAPISTEELETSVSWIEPIFQRLLDEGRERDALELVMDCGGLLANPQTAQLRSFTIETLDKMVDSIMDLPSSLSAPKARAMSIFATMHEGKLKEERVEYLEQEALQIFENEGHAHGAVDIRIRKISRNIKKDYRYFTDEILEELNGYFEIYDKHHMLTQLLKAIEALLMWMPSWLAFDLQLSLSHIKEEVVGRVGSKLFGFITQIQLLSRWNVQAGKSSRVVEAAEGLDALVSAQDFRWLKGMIANILSQAYAQIDDDEKAHSWATEATNTWGAFFPLERAGATTAMLQAKLNKYSRGRDADPEAAIAFAEAEIDSDLENGFVEPAVRKMGIIIAQILSPRMDPRLGLWLDRMEKLSRELCKTCPEDGDMQLAAVFQNKGLSLLVAAQTRGGGESDDELLANFEQAGELYLKHRKWPELASTRQMQALAVYSIFQRLPSQGAIQLCIDLMLAAKEAFKEMKSGVLVSESSRWYAFYLYVAWTRGWVASERALQALEEAEEAWADHRADISVFKSLEAVSRKQQLISPAQLRDTYKRAFHICQSNNNVSLLWEWVQRTKARSLSDQLGVGALIPASLREQLMREPAAMSLIEEEEKLSDNIAASEPALRLKLRGELQALHRRMAEHPLLQTVLELKKGTPVTIEQIRGLGRQFRSKTPGAEIVFIDWVDLGGSIWLLALKGEAEPRLLSCQITTAEVMAWKREWLDAASGQEPAFTEDLYEEDDEEFCLRQLDRLVAPLQQVVNAGDLLVFCPTGVLHSIPLHALYTLDAVPVIACNPVVYGASLTTFWQCCQRAEPVRHGDWTMTGVFEPAWAPNEQAAVYECLSGLAEKRGLGAGVVATGASVTKAFLSDALQRSAMFHFHGHCMLDRRAEALADQSLELADGLFPVREVFDLKLQSPHITLVACDSASQGLSAGDEPLGLVTALLCAGAGSVIGTIWPTASRNGREFADLFYAELDAQRGENSTPSSSPEGDNMYNLATALQRSTLALRDCIDSRQPHHWAAFVLHGSWSICLGKPDPGT